MQVRRIAVSLIRASDSAPSPRARKDALAPGVGRAGPRAPFPLVLDE